jgi:hypothetical protein
MSARKSDLIYKGNPFLFVGAIWGFIAAFACPCPFCVLGTLSFLSAGVANKLGIGHGLLEKVKAMEHEHEHAHPKKG